MAGLLNAPAPTTAATPGAAPGPSTPMEGRVDDEAATDADDEEGEQPNVTPEEQAIYDAGVRNGLELIYEGSTVRPAIMDVLKAGATNEDKKGDSLFGEKMAVATAAVTIVGQLDKGAEQAGKPIPDDVLAHIGQAIVEELADVVEKAGIADFNEQDTTGAFYLALDMYRPTAIANGRTNDDTLKQQFGEIQQADQEGRLNEVLPGIDQAGSGPQEQNGMTVADETE